MKIPNYARRCKNKYNDDRFLKLHAVVNNNTTLCGKHLDEMWYIEHNTFPVVLTEGSVTCRACLKVINKEIQR